MRTHHAIPDAELRVVKRCIGAREDLIHGVARPPLADPNAPGEGDTILADIEGPRGKAQPEILDNADCLRQGFPLEEEGELIADETAGYGRARRSAAPRRRSHDPKSR